MLDLASTVTGKKEVESLADMAEGLLGLAGQFGEQLGPWPLGSFNVVLVERIA